MTARTHARGRRPAETLISAAALATALAAAPAQAQVASTPSYNVTGDPTVVSGAATFDRGVTTPGTDVYTIGSATAVLDFTPSDTATGGGVINFQNGGTTALYQGTPGGPAFTVLNRIVPTDPTRPIAFNGNVVSQLRDTAGNATRGGTLWFYSPGGLVIGDGSVFDVGSLLLSTGDPTGGSGTIASTTSFNLASTPDGGGIVNILSGATINATNAGSYVALVAPIVFQRGQVNVNGSAAYVAAESANLTFNQGLFDINVTVGSSAAGGFPLQHLGTTRFQNAAVQNRAYLVAVPKNDAITLVVGNTANLGFDIATTVGVENGLVVLGAGFRQVSATPDAVLTTGFANPSTVRADIAFDGGSTVNAVLIGRARDEARLAVAADTLFTSDVLLRGGTLAQATASGTGTVLTIGRDLRLDATAPGVNSAAAQTGGRALLSTATGGQVSIGRNVRVDASERGLFTGMAGATGASTGGIASIEAAGGTIGVGGDADVFANADSATTATGGSSAVTVAAGQTLAVTGQLRLSAGGFARTDLPAVGTTSGGAGLGGTAALNAAGTVQVGGSVSIDASGGGGDKITAGTGNGGAGTGGSATLSVLGGGSLTAVAANVTARGTGGGSTGDGTTGAATGGTALLGTAGALTLGGAFVNAGATSGGRTAGTGAAGAARAGAATLQAIGAGVATVSGNARVEALGLGGNVTGGTGAGGAGIGTDARIVASGGGRITLGSADTGAGGVGGAALGTAQAGGAGTGGTTSISQATGGTVTVTGNAFLVSNGVGGASGGGNGGNAQAGDVRFVSNDGTVTAGGVAQLTAQAVGGSGLNGGTATGGIANIGAGSGLTRVTGNAQADASAFGGAATQGTGGAATGGQALIGTVATGTITLASTVNIAASGTGGAGTGQDANGGGGTGGTSQLFAPQGTVTAGAAVTIASNGIGGAKTNAGTGIATSGGATGGLATITAARGTISLATSAALTATAAGGASQYNGGNAAGGTTQISVADSGQGGGGTIGVAGAATLNASASGGTPGAAPGTNGGAATGGTVNIFASAGNMNFGSVVGQATAGTSVGASAGTSPAAGGTATVSAGGGDIVVANNMTLVADGNGGTIGTGLGARDGGSGTGGRILVTSAAGRRIGVAQTLQVGASGIGGQTQEGGDRVAGAGIGGFVNLIANGTIAANAIVASASATGGSAGIGGTPGANAGGAATAGLLEIVAQGGTITAGSIAATSNGIGGSGGLFGNGGAADGGLARIAARQGGTLTVTGQTFVRAGGFGGSGGINGGGTGGDGRGGTSTDNSVGAIIAGNGGNITLGTLTQITADGSGGGGRGSGAGGVGTGGLANVVAFNGTVDLRAGQLIATANGNGGNAVATAQTGGNGGGAGIGGTTIVSGGTTTTAAGAAGRLMLGTANANALGVGGSGGDGLNGQAGGNGGDGTAGRVDVIAQAGNGIVTASRVSVGVSGIGGEGGNGSSGGSGGIGTGGGGNTGTASLPDSTFTAGSATFGLVDIGASGFGGNGGDGTTAATAGAGGNGIGGGYSLLSRGAPLTTGPASINAAGIGGAGGNAGAGVGGRGEGGEAGLLVTNRANSTARGSATIQQFIGDTSGIGGGGTGPSIAGRSFVTLTNGDATVDGLFFTNSGAVPAAGLITNLSASGGTLTLPTASIDAIGDIGLYTANGGRIVIGDGSLNATGTLRLGDGTTPSNIPGTLDIGNLSASLGTDLEIGRAFAVAGDLSFSSAGAIRVGDLAAGGRLGLNANGAITTGDLVGGGVVMVGSDSGIAVLDVESANASVDLSASETLSAGNIRAADSIALTAGGSLTAGNLTAVTRPDLLTDGSDGAVIVAANDAITLGDVTGLDIDIDGTDLGDGPFGDIATGTLTAEFLEVLGGGAVNVAGVRTAELYSGGAADRNIYAAELGAIGNLTIGAIDSLGLVAIASQTGNIATGAITTPSSIAALAAGNVTLASATTGRGPTDSLFVANASMLETNPELAVVLEDNEDPAFDPAILTGLAPLRIGGTFTVAGPVATGNLIAAAQGGVALGALDATTLIALDSGNAIALGDVTTPAELDLTSDGDITAGNIVAEEVGLASLGGSIATGAITANDEIILEAFAPDAAITTGLLRSGDEIGVIAGGAVNIAGAAVVGDDPDGPYRVGVIAGTDLDIGAVDSVQGIGLLARTGSITTGTLLARGGDIALLAAGSVTTAGATTSPANTVYVGNASQFPADFDPDDDDFDVGPLLADRPVRIGGAFTANGPISTGTLLAGAQGDLALGALDATSLIGLDSGSAIALGDVTTPASFQISSDGSITAGAIIARDVGLRSLNGPVRTGSITATDAISVDSGNGTTLGAIVAGQSAYVGGTGSVAIAGAGISRGRLTVDTAGNIALGATTTGTDTLLIATGGRIDATGPIAAGGSVALLADTGITTGALGGGRGEGAFVYLAGTPNRARINADGSFQPMFATDPGSLLLGGPLVVGGAISGGLIRSSVDGAGRLDGPIDGATRVRLFGRAMTLNGSITAPAIEVFGTDLALARGIAIGSGATQTLAIGALSTAAPTTLGGAGGDNAAGFTLDAAEIAQLRGAAISFGQSTRFGSGDNGITVRDLVLTGSNVGEGANLIGANGSFTVTSPGDIRVLGNVRVNNAAAGNMLAFVAADSFELVTDTGSIGLFGADNALGGRLAITANDIASADTRLFALGDSIDFDDIEADEAIAAIGAPAAVTRPEGFIQAGRIDLAARETLVIQNSGTADLAAGFTAGGGGMSVTSLAATGDGDGEGDPLAVVIYGRVQGEAGSFLTNADTRGAIRFATAGSQGDPLGGFADLSVVNGCALLASVACDGGGVPVAPERDLAVVTIGTDVLGVLDGPLAIDGAVSQLSDESGVAAIPDVRLTTVIDAAALATDAIVTEPIGSGGNTSLWEGGDEEGPVTSRGRDDEERRESPRKENRR